MALTLKKKQLTAICLLATGIVLVLLCGYALLTDAFTEPAAEEAAASSGAPASVLLLPAEVDVVSLAPAETPAPALPGEAVDITVNGRAVLSLPSRYDAESLLLSYLEASATAGAGERFLSAAYECDIRIGKASGTVPLFDAQTAFELLFSEPSLVPVTVYAESVAFSRGKPPAPEVSEESTLAAGSRIITQLGAGARTAVVTPLTYVGDALFATGDAYTETLAGSRAAIVRNGTYKPNNTSGEPKKNEGEKGKDAPVALHWPIDHEIVSYFGFREGRMHLGVDIAAKAGTSILTPAEGVVVFCRERGAYGLVIDIDHGGGFVSRLTHCDNATVELNQRVFAGESVATLAATALEGGKASLHYELLIDGVPCNPTFYCK